MTTDLTDHGVSPDVLPEDAQLSEDTLVQALMSVPCASVLVVGQKAALIAHRIIGSRDEKGEAVSQLHRQLRIHEDPTRDPDAWELF